MIGLRAAAATSPPTAQAMPGVLENLATIRKAVGVDAPQQLLDETAPPIELARSTPAGDALSRLRDAPARRRPRGRRRPATAAAPSAPA